MTRALVVLPRSGPMTGSARTVADLVRGAGQEGVNAVLAAPEGAVVLDVLQRQGHDVATLPRSRARFALALDEHAKRVDVVWARNVLGVGLALPAARRRGTPLIWDIGIEPASKGWVRAAHAIATQQSSAIVTQGKDQLSSILGPLAALARRKHRTIVPGVGPARRSALEAARTASPRPPCRILCLGTLHPRKNQLGLLEALAPLARQHPELKVSLAGGDGDAAYADKVRSRATQENLRGKVEVLGFRDDVPSLLATHGLLALPSLDEGVPHAVREASYAGLCVVATRVGGVPDIVSDQVDGRLVPPNDCDALRAVLSSLLSHPERAFALAAAARESSAERTQERWVHAHCELLKEVSTR